MRQARRPSRAMWGLITQPRPWHTLGSCVDLMLEWNGQCNWESEVTSDSFRQHAQQLQPTGVRSRTT